MKINLIGHSISYSVSFSRNKVPINPATQPSISQQEYNISDVFTYNRKEKNFFTNTVITGKNFGENYELNIYNHKPEHITGIIGDKKVNIKIEQKGGLNDYYRTITGNIGDKKVELVKYPTQITGKFANEDIDIKTTPMGAPEVLVNGKGIKLTKEMGYIGTLMNPKKEIIYGKYSMDKDFLPLIAGIAL